MTDLVIRDLDPILADRIRRVALARCWSTSETVARLLEQGLFSIEAEVRGGGFQEEEVDVLSEAIAALQEIPQGPSF